MLKTHGKATNCNKLLDDDVHGAARRTPVLTQQRAPVRAGAEFAHQLIVIHPLRASVGESVQERKQSKSSLAGAVF